MSNFYWWHPPVLCSEHHVLCWLIRYARKLLLQPRQLAVHVRLFLRSLIYSSTALICLSASDISPEGSALSSLLQKHLCCLYLLCKICRLLAEMPFSFQSWVLVVVAAAPFECISWVLVLGSSPLYLFFCLFYLDVGLFSAEQAMHVS